jgi:hypothetical protein
MGEFIPPSPVKIVTEKRRKSELMIDQSLLLFTLWSVSGVFGHLGMGS